MKYYEFAADFGGLNNQVFMISVHCFSHIFFAPDLSRSFITFRQASELIRVIVSSLTFCFYSSVSRYNFELNF